MWAPLDNGFNEPQNQPNDENPDEYSVNHNYTENRVRTLRFC